MSDVCPGCGAESNPYDHASTTTSWKCGAWQFRDGPHNPSHECLRRQLEKALAALAQRDERIRKLDAHLAAISPVVRAAMEHEEACEAFGLGKARMRDVAQAADKVATTIRSLPDSERAYCSGEVV